MIVTISAFARIMHCHGAPDAAVATGDKCNLVLELCAAAVIIAYGERLGHHRLLAAGLRGLMLRIAGLVILVMVLHTVATLGKSCKACSTSGPISLPRTCLLYTSPRPRDGLLSRMPSSACKKKKNP